MSTTHITLHDYKAAERAIAHETARVGLIVHGIVTLLVGAGLILINMTLAPEFPWSAFAVGGMLIGLLAHWWFGYLKLDDQLTEQQQRTEARAAQLR
jgi:2TM domain